METKGLYITSVNWDRLNAPPKVKANMRFVLKCMQTAHWQFLNYHPNNYVLNLYRDGVRMNVYLSTMTIQTAMNHPKKGKTQLNSKGLTQGQVADVFINPRLHTNGKGYHRKRTK